MNLEEIFGPGGVLATRLPSYEYRPSQLRMAQAVLDAIQDRHHLCVEAGTGTGKTLAYLIPALFSRKRVVVSTATKNLQEQLFYKDIPFIREHLFPKLSVSYMKGRQNYLCLQKLYGQNPATVIFGGAEREWQELSDWVKTTETGDRAELSWIRDDDPLWKSLDARSDTCLGQKCSHFSQCYITRMRQQALESDLIVVNHALFFANLALQSDEIGRILPDYAVLILDEAHEVEDAACSHFGKQVSNYQVDEFCRDLQNALRPDAFSTGRRGESVARPDALGAEIEDQLAELQSRSAAFFSALPGGEGRYSLNFFQDSNGATTDLRAEIFDSFRAIQRSLQTLYHQLQRQSNLPTEVDPLVRRLEQLSSNLEDIFRLDDPQHIYWFEKRGRGVFLHLTPLDIASVLRERLFEMTEAVVLTSATLATDNNFEYFKGRLGVREPEELIVESEFDYQTQAILYVPRAFPEPQSAKYFARALREIEQILEITEGHAFVLFTSFQQMDRFHRALSEKIPYPLLRQGDRPKSQLLDFFKKTPHAVLCATASFWQGVDVQGDALRAVIIDKLPFLAPTEPVVAARIHRLETEGVNSFFSYSVPEAIIALRQGLGRLIRSRQDRGILAVFDSRLRTRSYGQLFLRSLPNCPVTDKIEELQKFLRRTT